MFDHPSHSPDLTQCNLFTTKWLASWCFGINKELQSSITEWLKSWARTDDGIQKLEKSYNKRLNFAGDYEEKQVIVVVLSYIK